MEWDLTHVPWNSRPWVWVLTLYENDFVVRHVSVSLQGIRGVLWKRKFMWIDEWNLDAGRRIDIPEELESLFEFVESLHDDNPPSVDDVGTWGPVLDGNDTGFAVRLQLSRHKVYP
jgi:hypothetical protein